jgi:hypothetical protein
MQQELETLLTGLLRGLSKSGQFLQRMMYQTVTRLMNTFGTRIVMGRVVHFFSYDDWRVREQAVHVMLSALLHGGDVDQPAAIADLLVPVSDDSLKVQYVALEAYAVLARTFGATKMMSYLEKFGVDESLISLVRIRCENPVLPYLDTHGIIVHIHSPVKNEPFDAKPLQVLTPFKSFPNSNQAAKCEPTASTTQKLKDLEKVFVQKNSDGNIADRVPSPLIPEIMCDEEPNGGGRSPDKARLLAPTLTKKISSDVIKVHRSKLEPVHPRSKSTVPTSVHDVKQNFHDEVFTRPEWLEKGIPLSIPEPVEEEVKKSVKVHLSRGHSKSPIKQPLQAPKVEVFRLDERSLEEIIEIIKTGGWDCKISSFLKLESTLPASRELLQRHLASLIPPIIDQISNLRSTVSKSALSCISAMMSVGISLEHFLDVLVPVLIRRTSDPKDFIAEAAENSVTAVVDSVALFPRLFSALLTCAYDKNCKSRSKCAGMFARSLTDSPFADNSVHKLAHNQDCTAKLAPVLASWLRDGQSSTRIHSKCIVKVLSSCNPSWKAHAEKSLPVSQWVEISSVLQEDPNLRKSSNTLRSSTSLGTSETDSKSLVIEIMNQINSPGTERVHFRLHYAFVKVFF